MPERANKQRDFPTAEQIADLTEAVLTLNEQVRCLRLAVDEIEQELGWAIRTKVLDRLPPPQFPCDARLELHESVDHVNGFEHASDSEDELSERTNEPSSTPNPLSSRQAKLW